MTPRPTVVTERRRQILEAGMICFARKGYHQTAMDDIAAELHFSKGLLYYYFKTKRELFLAILQNWMDNSLQTWESLLSRDEDTTTLLHTCLNFGVQLIAQSTDLARVEFEFYGELGRDPIISEAFKSLFTEFRSRIKAIFDAGTEKGEIRPIDTDALSAVVLGVYEGLAMQAMVEPDRFDWSVVAETLYDVVMRGISP